MCGWYCTTFGYPSSPVTLNIELSHGQYSQASLSYTHKWFLNPWNKRKGLPRLSMTGVLKWACIIFNNLFLLFLVSTSGVFLFCVPFLGEDEPLVPYQRDSRIGFHWTGLEYFSFVSDLGFYLPWDTSWMPWFVPREMYLYVPKTIPRK